MTLNSPKENQRIKNEFKDLLLTEDAKKFYTILTEDEESMKDIVDTITELESKSKSSISIIKETADLLCYIYANWGEVESLPAYYTKDEMLPIEFYAIASKIHEDIQSMLVELGIPSYLSYFRNSGLNSGLN